MKQTARPTLATLARGARAPHTHTHVACADVSLTTHFTTHAIHQYRGVKQHSHARPPRLHPAPVRIRRSESPPLGRDRRARSGREIGLTRGGAQLELSRSSGQGSRARTACRGRHAPRRPRCPMRPPPPKGDRRWGVEGRGGGGGGGVRWARRRSGEVGEVCLWWRVAGGWWVSSPTERVPGY